MSAPRYNPQRHLGSAAVAAAAAAGPSEQAPTPGTLGRPCSVPRTPRRPRCGFVESVTWSRSPVCRAISAALHPEIKAGERAEPRDKSKKRGALEPADDAMLGGAPCRGVLNEAPRVVTPSLGRVCTGDTRARVCESSVRVCCSSAREFEKSSTPCTAAAWGLLGGPLRTTRGKDTHTRTHTHASSHTHTLARTHTRTQDGEQRRILNLGCQPNELRDTLLHRQSGPGPGPGPPSRHDAAPAHCRLPTLPFHVWTALLFFRPLSIKGPNRRRTLFCTPSLL